MATTDVVKHGIVLVPEGRQLFPYLTVMSNLRLGATLRKDKEGIETDLEEVYKLFPVLRQRGNQKAGTLSGGEQQMLALGRGLMANPVLLCMDEPSLGLAPIVIEQLGEVIKNINRRGVSVLLVEQNVHSSSRSGEHGLRVTGGPGGHERKHRDIEIERNRQESVFGKIGAPAQCLRRHSVSDFQVDR